LQTYTIITYATRNWPQAMLSFYPSTTGYATGHQWVRVDNASMKKTPGAALLGTGCYEPGAVVPPPNMPPPSEDASLHAAPAGSGAADAGVARWSGSGFSSSTAAGSDVWSIEGSARPTGALRATLDLRHVTTGTLTFESRFTSASSRAAAVVQVSTDGVTWSTIARVPTSRTWLPMSIDLSAYSGQIVWVRFAFAGASGSGWSLRDISVLQARAGLR